MDKKPTFGIWFWRTDSGAEVDFVLQEKGLLPVEAKAQKVKIGIVGKSLLAFLEKYQVKKRSYHPFRQRGKY